MTIIFIIQFIDNELSNHLDFDIHIFRDNFDI